MLAPGFQVKELPVQLTSLVTGSMVASFLQWQSALLQELRGAWKWRQDRAGPEQSHQPRLHQREARQ
jgi:hypothetical protein